MYVALALLSDVLDHIEARRGFRTDGFAMAVYGIIMVGMTGLASGIINAMLSSAGYDATMAMQPDGVQTMLVVCYLGIELVCYAVGAMMINFLKVERHIEVDHAAILERQKAEALAAGSEWVEPSERLRREQEETERFAEKARHDELRTLCARKGLSFEGGGGPLPEKDGREASQGREEPDCQAVWLRTTERSHSKNLEHQPILHHCAPAMPVRIFSAQVVAAA